MHRPIVVGYDGSLESATALDWALTLAERHATPVRIAWALDPMLNDLRPGHDHSHESMRASTSDTLSRIQGTTAAAHPALTVTSQLLNDLPVDALVTQSYDAALLVVGSRGAGGLLALIAGSTTLGVAARAHCTVVAVPRQDGEAKQRHGVVTGTDGSPVSDAALAFAFEQASEMQVPLTVVRAWHKPVVTSVLGRNLPLLDDPATQEGVQQVELADHVASWSGKYPDVKVTARVVPGNPVRALIDVSRNAELLVVGCRGRGAIQRAMLGSVSQGVLHLASLPVAVVPPNV